MTMNNLSLTAQGVNLNPIDEFLADDREGEISRPESVEEVGFDVKADDLAHRPNSTSQEHSLDDTQKTLTADCIDTDALGEAAEDAIKKTAESH